MYLNTCQNGNKEATAARARPVCQYLVIPEGGMVQTIVDYMALFTAWRAVNSNMYPPCHDARPASPLSDISAAVQSSILSSNVIQCWNSVAKSRSHAIVVLITAICSWHSH